MLQSIYRLYSRLSNRTIAIIVLILTLPVAGFVLNYFFAINTGTVELRSSLPEAFEIQVRANAITLINRSCTRTCTLESIPAGKYSYTAKTPGRKDLSGTLDISRAKPVIIELAWEYDAIVSPEIITPVSQTGSGFVYEDWITPNVVGYSTGSLSLGYFITIDASGLYSIIDTNTREGITLRLPAESSPITRVKPLRGTRTLIILTRDQSYSYSRDTGALDPLPYYADVERDQYGRMIALLRATSTETRSLLSLKESGDLLLDITNPGTTRVLQS